MVNYTLHFRLIKSCNATCDYCSAYEIKHDKLMSVNEFSKSLDFIIQFWEKANIQINHLSVEYVGGEVLLVHPEKLKELVSLAKDKLSRVCKSFIHGCQSNLIGSAQKVEFLDELFEGNVGTSVDHFTQQRKVGGSAEKYNKIFIMRQKQYQKKHFMAPGAVWILDKKSYPYLEDEINLAEKKHYSLVIRALFEGGLPINQLPINQIEESYAQAFDLWFLKKTIILQPFYQMLKRRMAIYFKEDSFEEENAGCHFQHDCANKSINLDPNGDLYICQEMADSHHYILGNTLDNHFNWDVWEKIKNRSLHLKNECYSCDFYKSCQGGCMNEAIESFDDVYGKTHLCTVWKIVFKKIDEALINNEKQKILNWLTLIEKNIK